MLRRNHLVQSGRARKGRDWRGLVWQVRKRKAITAQELRVLVEQYVRVDLDYAIWWLQINGVIGKSVHKGLYLVRAPGFSGRFLKDPIETISTLLKDPVFCYGSALEIHGLSRYGRVSTFYVVTDRFQRRRRVGQIEITAVKLPKDSIGVAKRRYVHSTIRVTDLERTVIDCIHRPKYCIGWENVLVALSRVAKPDSDKMVQYLKLLAIPSLTAKVGLVLEHYQKKWGVAGQTLESLRLYVPDHPFRFFANVRGRRNKLWNIYVPEDLFTY